MIFKLWAVKAFQFASAHKLILNFLTYIFLPFLFHKIDALMYRKKDKINMYRRRKKTKNKRARDM